MLDKASAHRRHVAKLCERLCSQTAHLHGLTKPCLGLLDAAAKLHDCPLPLGEGLRLTSPERRIVSLALEAGRPGRRRPSGVARGRERAEAEIARRIAAVLRIADGLDRSGTQDTEIVAVVDRGQAVEILVSGGPTAAANARAAFEVVDLWDATALRPIRAIRVADGAEVPAAGIRPSDTVAEAARRIAGRQFEQFLSREYGLPYGRDIEYVHEMRVALRRLRSALRIFRKAWGTAARELAGDVCGVADALGTVRDLDVFVQFLRRYAGRAPREHRSWLRKLIRAEQRKRARHYRALLGLHSSECCRTLKRRLRRLLGAAGAAETARVPVSSMAPRALRQRLKRVLAYGRGLDRLSLEDQHALRIACKRLRYAAEFFFDIYPGELRPLIEAMVRMQDSLGDAHDADVYAERVQRYRRRQRRSRGSVAPASALLGHIQDWRDASLRRAASEWRAFRRRQTQRQIRETIRAPRRV